MSSEVQKGPRDVQPPYLSKELSFARASFELWIKHPHGNTEFTVGI